MIIYRGPRFRLLFVHITVHPKNDRETLDLACLLHGLRVGEEGRLYPSMPYQGEDGSGVTWSPHRGPPTRLADEEHPACVKHRGHVVSIQTSCLHLLVAKI